MNEYSGFVEFMGSKEDDPFAIRTNQVEVYRSKAVQQVLSMTNIDMDYPQVHQDHLRAACLMPQFSNFENPEERYITQHFLGKQYELDSQNDFAAEYIRFMYNAAWLETRAKPKVEAYLQNRIDEVLPKMSREHEYTLTPMRQIELVKIGNQIKKGEIDLYTFGIKNKTPDLAYEIQFITDYLGHPAVTPADLTELSIYAEDESNKVRSWEYALGNQLIELFSIVLESDPKKIIERQLGYMYDYTGGSLLEKNSSTDLAFEFLQDIKELTYSPARNSLAEVFVHNMAKLAGKETMVYGDEIMRVDEVFLTQQQAIELITDIEETLWSRR